MFRTLAAIALALTTASAAAGGVNVYTPQFQYAINGTSFLATVKDQGDFTLIDASISTRPPNPNLKVKGYPNWSGSVTLTNGTTVSFLNCTLLNFNGGEQGLLHYEIFCFTQVGQFW